MKLVSLYSTIKMMQGQINIRFWNLLFCIYALLLSFSVKEAPYQM